MSDRTFTLDETQDKELEDFIGGVVQKNEERHHIEERTSCRHRERWHIGG